MKILLLTDFYHPFTGGVESHVGALSVALMNRGHQVEIVTTLAGNALPSEGIDGVPVHRVRPLSSRLPGLHESGGRPWLPPTPDPAVTRAIKSVVDRFQPDVVHGHDWLSRSFLPVRKTLPAGAFVTTLHYYTRSCAKKTLMLGVEPCQGPAIVKCGKCAAAHYGPVRGPGIAVANAIFARSEAKSSDATIAVSRATAEGNGINPDSPGTYVIPNMIEFGPGDDQETPTGLPAQPFLLFVGDMRTAKGIHVLCRAYSRLTNPPPLVVVGARTPETPIPLPPGVIELGELPNNVVRAIWQRCLFGKVPSIWGEPFGIVVLECLAAGKPVVASRVGGIPEIVTDNQDGVLVPPGDEGGLADAMAALIGDDDRRERLGNAASITARQYTPDRIVPRIESVYEWAVAGRHV